MKTVNYESVITEQSIKKCLEYSDEPEKLRDLINNLDVSVKFTGIKKHFQDDKEERLTGNFQINKKNGYIIDFDFGFSSNDTEIFTVLSKAISFNLAFPVLYHGTKHKTAGSLRDHATKDKKEFFEGLLYDALCCCNSNYYCDLSFDDFCNKFGYDADSIKHKQLWETCLKQAKELKKVFTEEEINYLPS